MDLLSVISGEKESSNTKKLIEPLNSIVFLIESKKGEVGIDEIYEIVGRELLKEGVSFLVTILDSKKQNLKIRYFSSYPEVVEKVNEIIDSISTNRTFSLKYLDLDCYNFTVATQEAKLCKNRIGKMEKQHSVIHKYVKSYDDLTSITTPLIIRGEIIGFLEYFSPLFIDEYKAIFNQFSKTILRYVTNTLLFQEVKKSEEKYKDIFENSKEGFFIINGRKKKFVEANRAMSNITGYTNVELMQMNYILLFEESETKRIDGYVKKRLAGESGGEDAPTSYETKVLTKNGIIKYVTLEISRIISPDEWFVILKDISSKKEFENKLKKSEEKYRKLVDNATDMVVIVGKDEKLEFVNDAFLEITGYGKEEVVGSHFSKFAPEENLKKIIEKIKKRIIKKGTINAYEFKIKTKDNEIRIVSFSGSTIEDKGEVVGVQAIVRDITEDKLLLQKIEKSKKHYEIVIDTINDSLFVVDKNFQIISFNKKFIQKTGIAPHEIKNKHCYEILNHYDNGLFSQICNCSDRLKEHCDLGLSFLNKKSTTIEKAIIKNGKKVHYKLKILPTTNKDNEVYQAVVLISDVTKEKEAQSEISRLHEFTSRILDNVPLSIVVIDRDACITSLNAFGKQLFNDDVVGRCLVDTDEIKSNKQLIKYYNNLVSKGETFYYDNLPYKNNKKGEQKYLNIIAVPLYDQNKKIEGAISMGLDNTEAVLAKRRLEDLNRNLELKVLKRTQELNEINKKLYKAIDLKSKFISDASHELRTPMTVIKGNLDLAIRENQIKGGEMPEIYEIINYEIGQISGILSDLTMLTNIDSMAERLLHEKVDVDKIIKDTTRSLEVLASEKKITLGAKLDSNIKIFGDEAKLEKVMLNIIRNAIKYTNNKGNIKVWAQNENNHVAIKIRDNGIGIPEKDLPYIFERFYRVDKARTRAEGGTGLGLSISKWIVEAHNGYIEVESKENEGCVFTIHLPKDYKKEKVLQSLF